MNTESYLSGLITAEEDRQERADVTTRISHERLAQLIDFASWPQLHESVTPDVASALAELQQSRAVLAALAALSERMSKDPAKAHLSPWACELKYLLAAHDKNGAKS